MTTATTSSATAKKDGPGDAIGSGTLSDPRPGCQRDDFDDLSSLYFPCDGEGTGTSSTLRKSGVLKFYVNPSLEVATNGSQQQGQRHNGKENRKADVLHGRGLVASRRLEAGELLFVTPPAVEARVGDVRKLWLPSSSAPGGGGGGGADVDCGGNGNGNNKNNGSKNSKMSVAAAAEEALLRATRELAASGGSAAEAVMALSSGGKGGAGDEKSATPTSIATLTGYCCSAGKKEGGKGDASVEEGAVQDEVDDDTILQVIRHNAFGCDYPTIDAVERSWLLCREDEEKLVKEKEKQREDEVEKKLPPPPMMPRHVLGLYPLAAMINHSCVGNALRVFVSAPPPSSSGNGNGNDTAATVATVATVATTATTVMVARASRTVEGGEEIVWPYLPPSRTHPKRKDDLRNKGIRRCRCERCAVETEFWNLDGASRRDLALIDGNYNTYGYNLRSRGPSGATSDLELVAAARTVQDDVLSLSSLTNQTKRYLTVSFLQLFVNYLNVSLSSLNKNEGGAVSGDAVSGKDAALEGLLKTASQLHFACCACHNASTEHLSILHLCYELQSALHASASNRSPDKTLAKVRFWTEQLKRAHLVRYGGLGGDVDAVRRMLKHTRQVLRNPDGHEHAIRAGFV